MAREVFLKSSEIFASREPASVSTVVGSCVAVAVFDHARNCGGMNHFLLPEGNPVADGSALGKFGSVAVPELVRRLEVLGSSRGDLVAKVVGGASVLSVSSHNHIPKANVEAARRALAALGIPIVGLDVGGTAGRKVTFQTGNGQLVVNGSRRI